MQLLISDANIIIDIEVGELIAPMFSLNYQFVVPDILYVEELETQHAHLLEMGLMTRSLSSESVARVVELSQLFTKPSRNDLFALSLAEIEKCPLLTGDAGLKQAARTIGITVMGTIWLIERMILEQRITIAVARASLEKMRLNQRRLPWDLAERKLIDLNSIINAHKNT